MQDRRDKDVSDDDKDGRETQKYSTLITSPNGHSVFLFGCKENPESIYELFNTEGNLSWRKLLQTLTYPRYNTVAMLIPDELVTCNNLESTTVTSTMRTLSHSETLISESASFNLYIWLALICSLLIGLLITAIEHFRKRKSHLLTDEQLSLFWTKNDDYVTGNVFDELPNFDKANIIKGYFIGILYNKVPVDYKTICTVNLSFFRFWKFW